MSFATLGPRPVTANAAVAFTSDNRPSFFNPRWMPDGGEPTSNERGSIGLRASRGAGYATEASAS
ncbi:MAG: hypothetical protein OXN89_26955 [Bryobacterales bacterium]|nr:hypothetical protein [Bryobacterales bacterium]